ncbi:MAG: hypothetical protein ACLSS7_09345 [Eubacterium ventriosum]|uniref:hypothetical protein n=1 Tax=Eubacterium TaxID=1730 RepID=UPI0035228FDD
MSTIVLYKDRLNGINTYINDVTNSCDSLSTQLNSLKSILQGVSSNSCNLQDTVNNISSSTKTEKDKIKDLKKLNKKIGEFISVTVKKDNSVKEQIEKTKKEFYTKYSYLKPECEKNGLEKVCDGLKSAVSWLVDNIKEILVVGLAVLAVVAVVALAIATFGLGAVAIATVVGAAAGLASQLITDIVSGFVTGNFKVSSPLNYISSAVGGAIGGIIMLPTGGVAGVSVFASKVFGNFALAATADVFVSTSLSEGTPMIFSKEKLSLGQWGSNVAVGTALSLVLAKGFDGFTTKFNKGLKNTGFKITERFAGSHSYRADYNRSIKRLIHKNSSLKNITYRTYRNGFMAEFTENIFSNPTNGVLGVGWDEIKELVFN